MNVQHLFLVTPQSLNLVNAFLMKGQNKVQKKYNLSLKSLDTTKTVHIGSLEAEENSHIQLRTRPPHLIPVQLLLSLDDRFITLHINLSSDELLNYTITPTNGLKLHSQRLPVTKYNTLQNRIIYKLS